MIHEIIEALKPYIDVNSSNPSPKKIWMECVYLSELNTPFTLVINPKGKLKARSNPKITVLGRHLQYNVPLHNRIKLKGHQLLQEIV